MSTSKIEIAGQRFGRWLVLDYAGAQRWNCRCDCGVEQAVLSANLRYGQTQSCGCLCAEMAIAQMTQHGASTRDNRTPEYRAWENAKSRCYNPNHVSWKYYGKLGVKVCAEWIDDFEAFLSYVGQRPSVQHSLDRYPDKDGNYEPGNVRWATDSEQIRNRRNSLTVSVRGEVLCLKDAAAKYGVRYTDLANRLRRGWNPERALGLSNG